MVTLGLDADADGAMPVDVPSRDVGIGCEVTGGYEDSQNVTKPYIDLLTDCDSNEDQIMAEHDDQQQMVLRSVRKSHTEKFKKGKNIVEELLIDSDDENNLVIDCDITSEENLPTKAVMPGKLRDRKRLLLRPKIQNGHTDINEKIPPSNIDAIQEPGDYVDTVNKKKKRLKFRSRWHKSKIRKGEKVIKPLKGLQQTELQETVETKSDQEDHIEQKVENGTFSEKKICPICHEEFSNNHFFTLHIREHNTDKFSHVCKICSKQLSSASSLDRHMYVHSGERPFECSVCSLKFTTNGNMHRHMKIHDTSDKPKSKNDNNKGTKRYINDDNSKGTSNVNNTESSRASDEDTPLTKRVMLNIFSSSNKDNILRCPVCARKFTSADTLKFHMIMHSNDPIKCSTCNMTFENYAVYEKHSCSSDTTPLLLNFPKIGFQDLNFIEFSSSKFALVAKQICENQSRNSSSAFFSWECIKCAKAFPSNRALYQHELSHENDSLSCHTCKCDFPSPKLFRDHQLKHRLTEQCSKCSEFKDEESAKSRKEDFLALLELCNKQSVNDFEKKSVEKLRHFDSMQYFVQETSSSETKDEECESGNDFADITSIISLTSKTPIMPDMRASPVMASPASPPPSTLGSIPVSPVIEGSANAPPFDQPLLIEEGSNSMSVKGDDNTSKDSFAGNGENNDCKQCNVNFITPVALQQHMRAHSKSTPLHQCNFCPYQSVDKSTLKRHMRKHNGEHPFKCSICDYVFTTKANGHRHVKNKHKLSEQAAADAVVYNPNMLEAKDAEGILSESNSSETVCKYCKTDFKYNRVLRHHLRSLNNSCSRKPYSCSICKQGFSTKNNCIRHITNHHPESKDKAKELVIVNEMNNSAAQDASPNASEEVSEGETASTEVQPLNLTLSSSNEESSHCADQCPQEFTGSEAEMVVAQSLVSLSELIPPQEKPLDLTLCALDLSLKDGDTIITSEVNQSSVSPQSRILDLCTVASQKSVPADNKKSSPTPKTTSGQRSPINLEIVHQPLNLAKSSGVPVCLVTSPPDNVLSKTISNGRPLPLVCLPQSITPIRGLISNKSNSVPVSYSTPKIPFVPTASDVCSVTPVETMQPEEAHKNSQKVKKFSCDICFKGFTLKSNRERHIKNHHPEHARPPRSRNYIPTLSPTNVQKQNSSTLSDRTRDALRVALIAKTSHTSSKQQELKDNPKVSKKLTPTNFIGQFSQSQPIPRKSSNNHLDKSRSVCSPSKDKNDATDLASVSDVIDAVNCQNFKQYLLDAKGTSDSSGVDEPTVPEVVEIVSEDEGNKDACEKKSSYAKCTKSIHCTYCKRKFPWKSSLSRHFLTHTGLKPHKCPKCPLSFTTKSNRDRHLFRQHGGLEESATLSDKPFKCNSCPNSYFSTKGKLKKHFHIKHASEGKSSSVVKSCASRKDSGSNEMSSHRSFLSNNSQKGSSSDSGTLHEMCSDADNCSATLECHLCMNAFKAQEDLLSHLKEVHPLEINSSNQEDSDVPSIVKIEPTDSDEQMVDVSEFEKSTDIDANASNFQCSHCSLQFKNAQELENHAKSHTSTPSTPAKVSNRNTVSKTVTNTAVKDVKESFLLPANCSTSLPKKAPNSLLYLFAAAQQARTVNNSTPKATSKPPKPARKVTSKSSAEKPTENDNSLILNLLGLKDPEFLDEMLDSAARSLVKKEKVDT